MKARYREVVQSVMDGVLTGEVELVVAVWSSFSTFPQANSGRT